MIRHSTIKEEKNKANTLRIREQYFSNIKDASIDQQNMMIELDQCLKKLVSRKQAILKHSIIPFVDIYAKFKKIHFNSSDGIEELEDFEFNMIREEAVNCVNSPNFTIPAKNLSSQ